MYVNRFLCGVDGVNEAGGRAAAEVMLGGVFVLEGSCTVVEYDDSGSDAI